jgi:hypothetical protein
VAQLTRNYEAALARVSEFDQLRAGLGFAEKKVRPAAQEASPKSEVVVTLQGGAKIKGTLVREDKDRLVVDTGAEETEIARSQVASIARPKALNKPMKRAP